MIHPVICDPRIQLVVRVTDPVAWGAGDSGLPSLAAGEFFLIDDSGNYLTDENGAFLTGTNA